MLPGFSANYSLYQTRMAYRTDGAWASATDVFPMSNGPSGEVPGGGHCTPESCPPGLTCCIAVSGIGGTPECYDTNSDIANCGGCYQACRHAGDICCQGRCEEQTDASCGCPPRACPTGYKCCGAKCISVTGDTKNCGACGHHCSHLEKCVNGKCCFPEGDIAGAAALLCLLTGGTDCEAIYQELQKKACPA